jgi:prophage regulatory protein
MGNVMRQLDKPTTKLLSYGALEAKHGITFRRHLQRLEDNKQFPKHVALGENRIGWIRSEIEEWTALKLANREL